MDLAYSSEYSIHPYIHEEMNVRFGKMEDRIKALENEVQILRGEVQILRGDIHAEYQRNIPGAWDDFWEEPLEDRMDR